MCFRLWPCELYRSQLTLQDCKHVRNSKLYQGRRQFVQDSQDDFGLALTAFKSKKQVFVETFDIGDL